MLQAAWSAYVAALSSYDYDYDLKMAVKTLANKCNARL